MGRLWSESEIQHRSLLWSAPISCRNTLTKWKEKGRGKVVYLFIWVQLSKCELSGSFLVTATSRPLVRLGNTFTFRQ